MYSTKLVNSKMVANNAYITVGDPYQTPNHNPFRDSKITTVPFKYVGGHPNNAENGCFAKLEYKEEGTHGVITYLGTQPLDQRKQGFGTKDAFRRDEFSNGIRTEQYRATIKKEKEILKQTKGEDDAAKLRLLLLEQEKNVAEEDRVFQFDVTSTISEFNPKTKRDTYKRPSTTSSIGTKTSSFGFKTVSSEWGAGFDPTSYHAPEHGGHNTISHFYDKSHIRSS